MSDMDYGRGTYLVRPDGTFLVYAHGGVELLKLQLTPMQLIGLAVDLNKVAWSMMDAEKRNSIRQQAASPA